LPPVENAIGNRWPRRGDLSNAANIVAVLRTELERCFESVADLATPVTGVTS